MANFKLAVIAFLGTALWANAAAANFVVEPPKCDSSAGTAYVERGANLEAFDKVGSPDPSGFVSAMLTASNCFTVTTNARSADFIVSVGMLAKDQYKSGAGSFSGSATMPGATTAAGSPLGTLQSINKAVASDDTLGQLLGSISSGKMRHAYLQVNRNNSGELIGRGFGRNNTKSLDYSTWKLGSSAAQNVQVYNTESKARLVGGAIVNAYFDLQKTTDFAKPVMTKSATSTHSAAQSTSSGVVTLSSILKERRNNPDRFHAKYGSGQSVTISGYVANSDATHSIVQLSSSKRSGLSVTNFLDCNLRGSTRPANGYQNPTILALDRGQPITVSGTMRSAGDHSSMGLGLTFLEMKQCTIVSR